VLYRCLDALPEGGRALHLAPMTTREAQPLRLVPELPAGSVVEYLRNISWRGNYESLEKVLAFSQAQDGRLKIDIDIDTELRAKTAVATEFSYLGRDGIAPSREFLAELVSRGLCDPAKAEALAQWPGMSREKVEGYGWPITVHRLMDFKIVVHPDGSLEAKTYLGVNPHFSLFS
jgi:hypothetical protein